MIDTTNEFAVAVAGSFVVLLQPPAPKQVITRAQAIRLAAYLVSLADPFLPEGERFQDVLDAVEAT